ncbi:transposase [Acinetobacter sp. 256-1]|uniref:transposase n=1 Tax=Acinetobacter sp. 256-1 TaxID=2746721 RepID=UPI002577B858|nr:transposase [Acinetobacter sp. 256-1]MDM1757672.1 transposase [Acinetobacter sp. 256-1]
MDSKTIIDSKPTLKKPRRTFAPEFKNQLIQQCQQPNTSVAKIAMQHQINANLLHKWIRQSQSVFPALTTSLPQTDFLLVILYPTAFTAETDVC